jgi:hypothetical protein
MPTTGRLLDFDGTIRRRARLAGRLAAAAIAPSSYPRVPVARAFWYDGIANFGDALTPWLLRRAGIVAIHARPKSAEFVGVGSILEMLPADFDGAIWGSGLLRDAPVALPNARILAVRGHMTADHVGAPTATALGDPGLLVSMFMKRPRVRWRLGIVPHHMHEDDPIWQAIKAQAPSQTRVINVRRGPTAVLGEIAACDFVLSTSLHGLITADAFGIPAAWARREPDLWGGRFKFLDYESAVTPGSTREIVLENAAPSPDELISQTSRVDSERVRLLQTGLLDSLHSLELPRAMPLFTVARALGR